MLRPTRGYPLKKLDSPSPGSYPFPLAPQLRVGLHASFPSPCWDFIWLELVQVLCVLSQLLWVHMCNCLPWYIRKTLFHCGHPLSLALTVFLLTLAQLPLSLGRRGWDTDVPFRVKHSEVFYSLYLDQLWVSVNHHNCKKKLLCEIWEMPQLWVEQ